MGKNYGAYNFESKQIETLLLEKLVISKWINTGALRSYNAYMSYSNIQGFICIMSSG